MAQAARQYYGYRGYAEQAVRSASPERALQPDVQVIPGTRSANPALCSISPEFARAFKLVIVIIVAFAAICALRVWMSTATVSMLDNVSSLEVSLSSARATTNELEIQHSILSSSTRIEEEAAKIGMVAPGNVEYLKVVMLGKVALYPDGTLSLSGTIQNLRDYMATRSG